MSAGLWVRIGNRRSARLASVPAVEDVEFGAAIAQAVGDGGRIVALFGMPEGGDRLRLVCILANDAKGQLAASSSVVARDFPSIAARCPQAIRFEREIMEQCGARPTGATSTAGVRGHAPDHAPAAWRGQTAGHPSSAVEPVSGDEVHEVAVGPVHAGIIEPGHFRFQAHGEEVLRLDIALGFQHRGVESLLERLERRRAVYVAESIAGDSVVAHASAWAGVVEALARCHKSPRAQAIRGIALELERLANHVGDLGAMAGDIAFQPAAAWFGRLRGECLNATMLICGNRYGRGLVRPGGAIFDIPPTMAAEIGNRMRRVRDELKTVAGHFFGDASVQSRLEGVGVLARDACREHGFVGPVARSCEVPRDVRHDHPYGVFRFAQLPVATAWAGDVFARALVRWVEIQRSLEFVEEQLQQIPGGPAQVGCAEVFAPDELVVALEEGWRGEVAHVLVSGADGSVRRHKVVDPSFHNWPALERCMAGNEISDFPLCNKSFNLSYAGHDL